MVDVTKSLQELEHDDWGEPTFGSSLVRSIHAFRRIPVRDLTVEQLRVLIGQQVGLQYLIPLALKQLEQEPFVSGDLYEGDLLQVVLVKTPDTYWLHHKTDRTIISHIIKCAYEKRDCLSDTMWEYLEPTLEESYRHIEQLN